jgi:hypothetical protein
VHPPIWTGILLAVTAMATVWWWALDLGGAEAPPHNLLAFGRVATAGAAAAGAVHLTSQILAIL